jgi:hypothetical protein
VANRSSIIIGGVVGSAGLAHSRVRHAGDDPTLQASARGGGCTQVPRGPSGYLSARQGTGCSVVDADFVPLRQRTHTNYVAAIHVPRAKGTGRVAVEDATAGGHASTVGVGALLLVPARLAVPFDLPIRFTATLSSSASSPS